MKLTAPQSLKHEHDELHQELVAATKAGGRLGDAAQAVARALHPHFEKEEEYAMPLLGLLSSLAEGSIPADGDAVIASAERLKKDIGHMLDEHKAIVMALRKLTDEARNAGRPEYARFADKLKVHAQTEEEVLYPAAILIGEFLKLKAEFRR